MYKCELCEKEFARTNALTIPKCCQAMSESQYRLCAKCIKKCDKCPFCRSPKAHSIESVALAWEIEHMVYQHALYRTYCECMCWSIGITLYGSPYHEGTKTFEEIVTDQCLDTVARDMSLKIFKKMTDILNLCSLHTAE